MFSDSSGVKLEIHNKKKNTKKNVTFWKFSNAFINNLGSKMKSQWKF